MSPSLLVLAALTLLACALPWLLRPRFIKSVPHGAALPLLGNALDVVAHMRNSAILSDLFAERVTKPLGPLSQFMLTAWSPVLVVADLGLAEHICTSKDYDKGAIGRAIFSGLAPYGMLALPTDAMLRLHRRALAPTMTPAFLAIAGDIFGAHTSSLLRLWQHRLTRSAADGAPADAHFFDLERDIKSLTTDAISQITFGESFGQLAPQLAAVEDGRPCDESLKGGTLIARHMNTLFESLCTSDIGGIRHWAKRQSPSYRRAYAGMHAYVDGQINAARRRIVGGGEVAEIGSVIDMVIAKEGKAGEGAFLPKLELIDELGTFLVTGEETTSTGLTWVHKFLSENPDVQDRLFEELQPEMPSPDERPVGYKDICGKLPYLEAVVHEVLRLGSVVRAVPREAVKDTTLIHPTTREVVHVAKGVKTIVMLHEACMVQSDDRRVGWAVDPSRFHPSRWLDADGKFDLGAGPSIPFTVGPRHCFGERMALMFLRIFTAQLSLNFHLAALPADLHEDSCKAFITRRPVRNFVGPRARKGRQAHDEGYFSRERSVFGDESP